MVYTQKLKAGLLGGALCLGLSIVGAATSVYRNSHSGKANSLPRLHLDDPHLAASEGRWVSRGQKFQFDVTYTGVGSDASCVYQMYDNSGEPVGAPVRFTMKAYQKTTLSLAKVTDSVAWVEVGLR